MNDKNRDLQQRLKKTEAELRELRKRVKDLEEAEDYSSEDCYDCR